MSKNITSLSGRKGLDESLFEKIGQLTEAEGFLSKEAASALADEYLIGDASVYGAATFYDFTRPENKGKKVYVCNGTACLCAGTQAALRQQLQRHFQPEEIGEMCCLGRCHENGAFHYNGHNYSGPGAVEKAVGGNGSAATAHIDTYHFESRGAGILAHAAYDMATCRQIVEKVLATSAEELLNSIKASGLRGRGGAGFPIGIKLEGCGKAEGDVKFIVCNADEGDPGSYSDRWVLEQRPHAMLLGMLIAGYVTGAHRGVVYIRYEYPESIEATRNAIEQLRQAGLLGTDILGSGFEYEIKVVKARGAYICGEETALLASLEGQRPGSARAAAISRQLRPVWQTHRGQQRGNPGQPAMDRHARRRGLSLPSAPNAAPAPNCSASTAPSSVRACTKWTWARPCVPSWRNWPEASVAPSRHCTSAVRLAGWCPCTRCPT
ncbi:MAG: hypothetical protein KatS3mg029_0048 [Saprospiraceae bacterium]|nr:MAG: hypothetical protein KatS3mg029_0048 [Saprospiraceae bacterium]